MTRLRAADIAAGYENKKIIENMSVTIPEGKITSLIGPNGSGKSTLLKSFTRILPVKSGKIIVNNSDISTYSSKELAKKIALLAQTSEQCLSLFYFNPFCFRSCSISFSDIDALSALS